MMKSDISTCFLRFTLAALFSLLTVDLNAAPETLDEQPTMNLKWKAISMGSTLRDIYYESPDGLRRVIVPNGSFSSVFDYRGPAPLRFYRMVPAATVEKPDAVEPLLVAEAELSAETKEALVFLTSGPDHSMRALALQSAFENTPPGSIRFINLTPYPLVGYIRDVPFQLAPGDNALSRFRVSAGSPPSSSRIRLACERQNGVWSREINTTFSMSSDTAMTLVFKEGARGSIEMMLLPEFAAPTEATASAGRIQ